MVDGLAEHREVLLVDLPGHGESAPFPAHWMPTAPGYAVALAGLLDELEIETAHVAGFSIGGWTALELAKLGRARSVVAISPAGLWRKYDPLQCVGSLALSHWLSQRLRRLAPTLVRTRLGRTIALGQNFGKPWRVPADRALHTIETFADTPDFALHLAATRYQRFHGGRDIGVPVTVVFGQRDRLIPARARRRDELPAQTRWLEPEGCGHVPFWDEPELITRILLDADRGATHPHDHSGREAVP